MNKIYLPTSGMNNLEKIIKESWELKVRLNQLGLNERKIIILSGDYGVGKDVWANLIKTRNLDAEIIRFSDPLREAFVSAGVSETEIDTLKRTNVKLTDKIVDGYDLSGLTMREALIHVAESNKEKYGQDYYAKQAVEKAQSLLNETNLIIFTDMRFDVEHLAILNLAKDYDLLIERLHIPTSLPKIEVI